MPKRGENIYKRKDGRWEGRVKNGGTKKKYFYGKTYKEVKEKMLLCKSENESNLLSPNAPGFAFICDEWLDLCKTTVKESTYAKYFFTVNNHIKPYFKNMPLEEITFENIELFAHIKRIKKIGERGLSSCTIRAIVKILGNILKLAYTKKYFTQRVTVNNLVLPSDPRSDIHVLTKMEQLLLLTYIRSQENIGKIGILVCIYTGLRIGEICALKWKNIDFIAKTIYVCETMQRIQNTELLASGKTKIIETSPKTRSSVREIPIPDFLVEMLLRYSPIDKASYFLTGNKGRYIEPRTYENIFKKCLSECEIRSINFHALRHTFATNCIEVGFEIKSLSEILGHSNVQITLNRYVHPTMKIKRDNMNLLTLPCA